MEGGTVGSSSAIPSGEPILSDTRTSVRAVVELWRQGISPEEIPSEVVDAPKDEIVSTFVGLYEAGPAGLRWLHGCDRMTRLSVRHAFGSLSIPNRSKRNRRP